MIYNWFVNLRLKILNDLHYWFEDRYETVERKYECNRCNLCFKYIRKKDIAYYGWIDNTYRFHIKCAIAKILVVKILQNKHPNDDFSHNGLKFITKDEWKIELPLNAKDTTYCNLFDFETNPKRKKIINKAYKYCDEHVVINDE